MRFRVLALISTPVLAAVLAGGFGATATSALAGVIHSDSDGTAIGHNSIVLATDGTAIGLGKN